MLELPVRSVGSRVEECNAELSASSTSRGSSFRSKAVFSTSFEGGVGKHDIQEKLQKAASKQALVVDVNDTMIGTNIEERAEVSKRRRV